MLDTFCFFVYNVRVPKREKHETQILERHKDMFNYNQTNAKLHFARANKNGEFFIKMQHVVDEMPHYESHLNGKVVYIPNTKKTTEIAQCDSFGRYFGSMSMLIKFGIKELRYSYEDAFGNFVLITMNIDGSVSHTSIPVADEDEHMTQVYKQIDKCDVVIGNPEGHKLRDMFTYIITLNKDYILSANVNFLNAKVCNISYMTGRLKFGKTKPAKFFDVEKGKDVTFNSMWITSFDVNHAPKMVNTFYDTQSYAYQKFDNLDAINVECIKMIPMNYKGVMGVPTSIVPLLNRSQFEVIAFKTVGATVDGKEMYAKALIRFRNI